MIPNGEANGNREKEPAVKAISCERFQELFSYSAGKRHTPEEVAEMRKHFDECTECVQPKKSA